MRAAISIKPPVNLRGDMALNIFPISHHPLDHA